MKWIKICAVAAVLLLAGLIMNARGFGWSLVNAQVVRDFPEVKRITTSELAAWLADAKRPAPLLLDVRAEPEFEVSHLQNAEHVAPDAAAASIAAAKERPIVTYCSVGYRSAVFAQKLHAAGFSDVANLEGSIFAWANEGRPVFRDGQKVEQVHPYHWTWGLLLKKKYRAPIGQAEKG